MAQKMLQELNLGEMGTTQRKGCAVDAAVYGTQCVSNPEDSPVANICTAHFVVTVAVFFSADKNPRMSHAFNSFLISHKV